MGGFMWAGMIAPMVPGFVLPVAPIAALVWLIRQPGAWEPLAGATRRASIDALQVRYARGDIDRDAYLQIRRDITGS